MSDSNLTQSKNKEEITIVEATPTKSEERNSKQKKAKSKKSFFILFKFRKSSKSKDKKKIEEDVSKAQHQQQQSTTNEDIIVPKTAKQLNEPVKTGIKKSSSFGGFRLTGKKAKADKVLIEENSTTEVWKKVIDNSLIGTGIVTKAAICNISTCGIMAHNPTDFTPTVAQLRIICQAYENPKKLQKSGFKIADSTFTYESGVAKQSIYGIQKIEVNSDSGPPYKAGLLVYFGQNNLLVAVYERDQEAATKLCADLIEELKSSAEF